MTEPATLHATRDVAAGSDHQILQSIGRVRVAVIGDVMLDRYVHGEVDRISPEAPIPILKVTHEAVMPGAAGNVAANLHALGAEISLIGLIGNDAAGHALTGLLGRLVDGHQPLSEPGRRTTVKTRFVAGGQQLLRADDELVAPPSPVIEDQLGRRIEQAIAEADAVILSDYGKGVLSRAAVGHAIARARAAGVPVIVDPKGRDYGRYRGASVVTPNQKELAEEAGHATHGDAECARAAAAVLQNAGIDAMVATRGARGMAVLAGPEKEAVFLPAHPVEVFDVSGAGDTVVAVLALVLGGGGDLVTAARLANLAGGLVVAKPGTATVDRHDLVHALNRQALDDADAKVFSPGGLDARIAAWRQGRLVIGFTNGCFDLLHPGHVRLLAQARAACDRLVVGLNSDASVGRLKGPDRPIQGEASRAVVLAALASVDAVTLFEEDTPLALIERIRPDVLIKGADYARHEVVGAAEVEGWGGRVVLVPLQQGHSTTALVQRSRG